MKLLFAVLILKFLKLYISYHLSAVGIAGMLKLRLHVHVQTTSTWEMTCQTINRQHGRKATLQKFPFGHTKHFPDITFTNCCSLWSKNERSFYFLSPTIVHWSVYKVYEHLTYSKSLSCISFLVLFPDVILDLSIDHITVTECYHHPSDRFLSMFLVNNSL